jgi:hypothetical protein
VVRAKSQRSVVWCADNFQDRSYGVEGTLNKDALKKNSWTHVRIRPMAKRFWGADGPQLPPVDDHWLLYEVGDKNVFITNSATGHGTVLGLDQIHHYSSDPATGPRCGILTLNAQLHIGGDHLWTEPTFRPGQALPDQFADVRDWKRENDAAYVRSLYPPQPVPQVPVATDNPALDVGLFVGLLLGVGIAMAASNKGLGWA